MFVQTIERKLLKAATDLSQRELKLVHLERIFSTLARLDSVTLRCMNYENGVPLFRRSYDAYSLGVILVEIACWEPIMVLCDLEERKKMARFEAYSGPSRLTWPKAVIDVVKKGAWIRDGHCLPKCSSILPGRH